MCVRERELRDSRTFCELDNDSHLKKPINTITKVHRLPFALQLQTARTSSRHFTAVNIDVCFVSVSCPCVKYTNKAETDFYLKICDMGKIGTNTRV